MSNALIAIAIGLGIWLALMWAILRCLDLPAAASRKCKSRLHAFGLALLMGRSSSEAANQAAEGSCA